VRPSRRLPNLQCLDCRCCLLLSGLRVGKRTCGGGRAVSPPTDLAVHSRSRRDQITAKARHSVQETVTAEHTVQHRGGESSVIVTTLYVLIELNGGSLIISSKLTDKIIYWYLLHV